MAPSTARLSAVQLNSTSLEVPNAVGGRGWAGAFPRPGLRRYQPKVTNPGLSRINRVVASTPPSYFLIAGQKLSHR
uniref:Uncharacterized protein n=1 Tax=Human herpesvirus 2 TaxID=10310 RepID=A0A481TQN1_HHV2|nr:hypothetical protein [Human alphaherpesvirus 2]QBH82811.1 hypothetical protein [Human alphaherpesvirus 2]QBH82945.1 hypothetical protein [Human alphaherpesvirus 2]